MNGDLPEETELKQRLEVVGKTIHRLRDDNRRLIGALEDLTAKVKMVEYDWWNEELKAAVHLLDELTPDSR